MKTIIKTKLLFLISLLVIFLACSEDEDNTQFVPKDPAISLDEGEITIENIGGEFYINIESNLPWRAGTDADWLTLDKKSGEGNARIKVTANFNRTLQLRNAPINFWILQDDKKQFVVKQKASTLEELITDYYVKSTGSEEADGLSWDNAVTLGKAMEIAQDGDRIHIAEGTYIPTKLITGGDASQAGDKTIEINKNLTIIGGYPANATEGATADHEVHPVIFSGQLDASNKAYHTVAVTAKLHSNFIVSIKGIQIRDGEATKGGTTGPNAGGITVNRHNAGGIIIGRAKVELTDCTIEDNATLTHGGAVFVFSSADVTMKNTKIVNNKGLGDGTGGMTTSSAGAIWVYSGKLKLIDSEVSNNKTAGLAGAIRVESGNELYVENTTISNNESASNAAGAIYSVGIVTIKGSEISNNKSGTYAGAIHSKGGKLTISDSKISNNKAGSYAGAIYADGGVLDIHNSTFADNTCVSMAGALYLFNQSSGQVVTTITNSTFSGNSNTNSGGAIYARAGSETLILNSTFYGNDAQKGGAIALHGTATLPGKMNIISTTINKNNVSAAGGGGGYSLLSTGTTAALSIYNSIVSGNTVTSSTLNDASGTATLTSTILGDKVYGSDQSQIPSLTFNPKTMLGALADNGGTTKTCTLQGDNNPARGNGISATDLQSLVSSLSSGIDANIATKDQIEGQRSSSDMGALVK